MAVAFAAAAVVLLVLVADLASPRLKRWRSAARRNAQASAEEMVVQDPGRERRAEQKARALLRSCVNQEDWDMYHDLGFIRVWSTLGYADLSGSAFHFRTAQRTPEPECAYLLYPHLPIIAYLPKTRRLVGEYCVTFEDETRPYGSSRLPDADDLLAKWMALTGDERTVVSTANMHLPGRQVSTEHVQRDLRRLAQWEQARLHRADHPAAAAS